MSLILEALKRSEQERLSDGDSPDNPLPLRQVKPTKSGFRHRLTAALILLAVLLVIGISRWWMAGVTEQEPASTSARMPAPQEPVASPPSPAVLPKAPAVEVPPKQAAAPTADLRSLQRPEETGTRRPPPVAPADIVPAPQESSPPVVVSDPPLEEPAEAANILDDDVPRLGQMPYNVQQAVKPLRLDVHVYDEEPLRRFVMINGKTFSEGAEIKSGLTVREIRRGAVVLTWKGRAFTLSATD